MTNVDLAVKELNPLGGATNAGEKIGLVDSAAKAAQNDTLTVSNASTVISVLLHDDTTGVIDAGTISSNVITLTTAATGTVSGIIIYK